MELTLEKRQFIDEVIDTDPQQFLLILSRYIVRTLILYGEDELFVKVQHLIQTLETQRLTHDELVQIARSINCYYPAPLRLKYLPVSETDRISHRLLRVLHYEMTDLIEIVNEIKNERAISALLLREARLSQNQISQNQISQNRFTSLLRLGIHGMEDIRHQLEHERVV